MINELTPTSQPLSWIESWASNALCYCLCFPLSFSNISETNWYTSHEWINIYFFKAKSVLFKNCIVIIWSSNVNQAATENKLQFTCSKRSSKLCSYIILFHVTSYVCSYVFKQQWEWEDWRLVMQVWLSCSCLTPYLLPWCKSSISYLEASFSVNSSISYLEASFSVRPRSSGTRYMWITE